MSVAGIEGRILRVDLSQGEVATEIVDAETLRKYPGGASLGARILYDEVPPGVAWNDPANRLIIASGPLGGTAVTGSGCFCVVTKGALTEGATSTQANGHFGAYLRLNGFDAIVLQGAAPRLTYLYIDGGEAELRDATMLSGMDTWDTCAWLRQELANFRRDVSAVCIGPAGENLVRFAGIIGDRGHSACHNGVGAVMGSKNLKAIAVSEGGHGVPVRDAESFSEMTAGLVADITEGPRAQAGIYRWGTLSDIVTGARHPGAFLPVKNYTTVHYDIAEDDLERYVPAYIHENYQIKRNPCYACPLHHCHIMTIPSGPYAGQVVEEPEYECEAACGPVIGVTNAEATLYLADQVDRLGFDINETGWLVGLVMECYEKGVVTKAQTDGLEMTWGNVAATLELLRNTATRHGFGNVLAEGVMRAARLIGGEAPNFAIHTMKGNTPRGHDHRVIWTELFDTSVSNTGTLESGGGGATRDRFSPQDVSSANASGKGWMLFEDSLGICRFAASRGQQRVINMLNAVTGWDVSRSEAILIGRRAANLTRAFNLRHGITADLDRPSPRYGSAPTDGPLEGVSILDYWDGMLHNYYHEMGWEHHTGTPLPQTLIDLGLGDVAADLWE